MTDWMVATDDLGVFGGMFIAIVLFPWRYRWPFSWIKNFARGRLRTIFFPMWADFFFIVTGYAWKWL